jgi:FXSXX-COOH protein
VSAESRSILILKDGCGVGIMKEMEKDSQPVRSGVPDVGGVPLSNVRALYADEVTAIVRRIVDDAQLSAKPPVAAFSSCILS